MTMIKVRGPNVDGLRAPRWKAPAGTVDAHCHIFGPESRYPYIADRTFTPADVSCEDYLRVCKTIGIGRAVLVQASGYGMDNSRQIDAAAELPFPTRVVVAVPADVDDAELDRLHAAGARGVRVVTTNKGGVPLESLERLAARVGERGWHLEFLSRPAQLVDLEARLAGLPCPVVIDHLAHIPATEGKNQPGFRTLQSLIETGNCWLKLSASYWVSNLPPPHADAIPLVHDLVERRPDRIVWGSDWPHVVLEGEVPDTADMFDLLLDWVPDEETRFRILVRNPENLYGFDPV